jgi:hypothetical protein
VISRSIKMACLAASIGMAGAVVVSVPAAWAGGNSGSATGVSFSFGGTFPGTVPPNCSPQSGTDIFGYSFVSGNANKSGGTIEGNAILWDFTTNESTGYLGHATFWGNQKGFTTTYHGSNGAQTIDFHITVNVHGIQVANLTCS